VNQTFSSTHHDSGRVSSFGGSVRGGPDLKIKVPNFPYPRPGLGFGYPNGKVGRPKRGKGS